MRIARTPVLALLLVAIVSGCTSAPDERPTPSQPASDWTPATAAIELGCVDGLTGPDLLTDANKLTSTVASALLEPLSQLPHAGDVGIPAPSVDWRFRKAPLFVAAGSHPVTLKVPDDGRQYLMWTSQEAWTDPEGDRVSSTWAATEVTVNACDELTTSFFGGLLVEDATRCFSLEIREEARHEALSIRADGSNCP